ncbi:MAG: hypothetical protein EXR72_05445 [Myxococcales bacterium]|nr:hypothetical protein [Myxococcales bacterium]
MGKNFGPTYNNPFPVGVDKPADPNERDEGVGKDANGYLGLDQTKASFDFLWAANTGDWQRGTVSKFNSKTVREVARYFTITCNSLKGGNTGACDGKNGCCAMDSYPQFQNRQNKMPSGVYQSVSLMSNMPSRTAVDFNGDLYVANRAFGGQSSVTKIANDTSKCVDRNGNGKIETSKDSNGDGVIQCDCNGDGMSDDIASVKAKPCQGAQEFYGLDDECILFTTNTGPANQLGRPLGLGPGALDFGPSDAWAGTYSDGRFYRVDGSTGITKDMAQLPNSCHPYGLVVDSSQYGWAGNLGAGLCYFNTKNTAEVGVARPPNGGSQQGYGITLDRDQNIWLAYSSAYRYTPDRSAKFAKLGDGFWTTVQSPGSQMGGGSILGIAADSRSPKAFFVWAGGGTSVVRIPASDIPIPKGMDSTVDGSAYAAVKVAGSAKGVGVAADQNVFNISPGSAVITRVQVDALGKMTAPDIVTAPMGANKCPGGDRCVYADGHSEQPYTYSDFTGFGLKNFTRPKGTWAYVIEGCKDGTGAADTEWLKVSWDAETPINTSITVAARAGMTPKPDLSWGKWTEDFKLSPADLAANMALVPNIKDSFYLEVEVRFSTMDKNKTPKLKGVQVAYKCHNIPG